MRRYLYLLVLIGVAVTAWAANLKLYLKDGTYQLVRDYKLDADRVRYYSIERSDWEEMPAEMVDLERTKTEAATRQAELEKEAKSLTQEDAERRELEKEVMRIPQNPGVYWMDGKEAKKLKVAESEVHTSKGRSVLQKLSPIPVVTGKGTLEIQNPHSLNIFTNAEQEFYIQLSDPERFGIVKLTTKGPVRIVENLTYIPVTKDVVEERYPVEILQQQLTPDGLYKIWPKEPLPAGEYAVVEFTEDKLNIQVWDFAVKAAK